MCFVVSGSYFKSGDNLSKETEKMLASAPTIANYSAYGALMSQAKRKRRKNVKTSALGLEDEETEMKTLTGQ